MTQLAGLTQQYDDAGNLTLGYAADRGTSYVYRYDHHNRLTGIYDSTDTTRHASFTWDALGRRVRFIDDDRKVTNRYYYDGVNEIADYDGTDTIQRWYLHGISYVDERLMMYRDDDSRPYYYVIDRMYNVWALVDRAGAIVERYAYDPYGRPRLRESAARGDMDADSDLDGTDRTRVIAAALNGTIWDPRADLDDDGDQDGTDYNLWLTKEKSWPPTGTPTVAQAFSDVDNPYMFQGVPHFALNTSKAATEGKLMLNHHRARFADVATGRWVTRDPVPYGRDSLKPRTPYRQPPVRKSSTTLQNQSQNLFALCNSNPNHYSDPSGADPCTEDAITNGPTPGSLQFECPDSLNPTDTCIGRFLCWIAPANCLAQYCDSCKNCCFSACADKYWPNDNAACTAACTAGFAACGASGSCCDYTPIPY